MLNRKILQRCRHIKQTLNFYVFGVQTRLCVCNFMVHIINKGVFSPKIGFRIKGIPLNINHFNPEKSVKVPILAMFSALLF